jgi:hypothetical protein
VRHGSLQDAFGFRIETADKVIVMSGDTAPTSSLGEHCGGCDVLIHEAYSLAAYERVRANGNGTGDAITPRRRNSLHWRLTSNPACWCSIHRANASGAMTLPDPEVVLLDEVRRLYDVPVVTAHDLNVF